MYDIFINISKRNAKIEGAKSFFYEFIFNFKMQKRDSKPWHWCEEKSFCFDTSNRSAEAWLEWIKNA